MIIEVFTDPNQKYMEKNLKTKFLEKGKKNLEKIL